MDAIQRLNPTSVRRRHVPGRRKSAREPVHPSLSGPARSIRDRGNVRSPDRVSLSAGRDFLSASASEAGSSREPQVRTASATNPCASRKLNPSRRTNVSASSVTVRKSRRARSGHERGVDLGGSERAGEQSQGAARVGEHGEHQRLKIVFAVIDVAERRVVGAREHRLGFAQARGWPGCERAPARPGCAFAA